MVVVMVGGVGGVRVAEVAVETRVRGGGCMGGLGWGCLARRCTSLGEARYFYFGGWEGCRRWMTGLCTFAMHRVWQTARTCVTVSSETKNGQFCVQCVFSTINSPPLPCGPSSKFIKDPDAGARRGRGRGCIFTCILQYHRPEKTGRRRSPRATHTDRCPRSCAVRRAIDIESARKDGSAAQGSYYTRVKHVLPTDKACARHAAHRAFRSAP